MLSIPAIAGAGVLTWALIAINVAVYLVFNLPLGGQPANLSDPALREYLFMIQDMIPPGMSMREVAQSVSAYDLVVFKHGFRPAAPEWMDLLTSLFLHGGFMHLFGNMLFLWIFGNNVEDAMGHLRFVVFYLLCGVAAVLAQALPDPASNAPMVGASGAISGVLGAYMLLYPRARVLLALPPPFIFVTIGWFRAVWVLAGWFVLQLLMGAGSRPVEGEA